jgi:hypothetical protein
VLSDVSGTGGGTITLNGTGLTSVTRSGNTFTISSTGDGSGSDDQNLSFTGSATPYTLNIEDGTGVTFAQGTGISLSRIGNELTITNTGDLSSSNEYNTLASWNDATNTFSVTDGGGTVSAVITGFSDATHSNATHTRGNGLTVSNYDGSTPTTWAVDFGGSGSSNQASRSAHNHTGVYDNFTSFNVQATGTAGISPITSGDTIVFAGGGISSVTRIGDTISIISTELDGDPLNEVQTLSGSGTRDITLSSISGTGGGVLTLNGTGGATVTRSGNVFYNRCFNCRR